MTETAAEAIAPQSHIPDASMRSIPQYLTRGTRDFLIRDEAVSSFADALKEKGADGCIRPSRRCRPRILWLEAERSSQSNFRQVRRALCRNNKDLLRETPVPV